MMELVGIIIIVLLGVGHMIYTIFLYLGINSGVAIVVSSFLSFAQFICVVDLFREGVAKKRPLYAKCITGVFITLIMIYLFVR